MNFKNCKLYGIKRKRDICKLLKIKNISIIEELGTQYNVRIEKEKRLIESPCKELKMIQRRLLNLLYDIEFPDNVFSGIKGRSAFDNASYHINAIELLKFDMSKFFPNIRRENVYNFFEEYLKMSPDVAKICTDITTIDYSKFKISEEVEEFLKEKKIKSRNHLPSGTPTSQILSYLANIKLFRLLEDYANRHGMRVSIYVDDITFSIQNVNGKINSRHLAYFKNTIEKEGYRVNRKKTKLYNQQNFKKITGFVIAPSNSLVVPNKINKKIKDIISKDKIENLETKDINSIKGLINFANISQMNTYKHLKMIIK